MGLRLAFFRVRDSVHDPIFELILFEEKEWANEKHSGKCVKDDRENFVYA